MTGPAWMLLLFLLLSTGQGCLSSLFATESTQPPLAWGVAVYPVHFKFHVPQYQAFLRGQAVADKFNSDTTCHVYGPGEFRISDPTSADLNLGTDLSTAVRFTRTRPPWGLYALRVTVSWAGASGEEVVTGDVTAAEVEGDVFVKAELLSLGEHSVVQSMEALVHHLPVFGSDNGRDPFPEVTAKTFEMVEKLIRNRKYFDAQPKPKGGLVVVPVLGPAGGFAYPGKKSLFAELSELKIEPVEREVILAGLTKIIDPTAPRARQLLYSSSPYGLVVLEAEEIAKTAGLKQNDLLLTVNGEKLSGRFVLDRHLAIGPSRVLLKRAGEIREVILAITRP